MIILDINALILFTYASYHLFVINFENTCNTRCTTVEADTTDMCFSSQLYKKL